MGLWLVDIDEFVRLLLEFAQTGIILLITPLIYIVVALRIIINVKTFIWHQYLMKY